MHFLSSKLELQVICVEKKKKNRCNCIRLVLMRSSTGCIRSDHSLSRVSTFCCQVAWYVSTRISTVQKVENFPNMTFQKVQGLPTVTTPSRVSTFWSQVARSYARTKGTEFPRYDLSECTRINNRKAPIRSSTGCKNVTTSPSRVSTFCLSGPLIWEYKRYKISLIWPYRKLDEAPVAKNVTTSIHGCQLLALRSSDMRVQDVEQELLQYTWDLLSPSNCAQS